MTYDNPVFLEQKKRRKETIDDSGFVRQYKLDEEIDISSVDTAIEEDDIDDNEESEFFDEPEDDPEEDIITVDDTSSVRDRLDMGLEDEHISDKPTIKFNIKPKVEEGKKPSIKFNLK